MRHLVWKRILFLSLSIILVLSAGMFAQAPAGGLMELPPDTESPYRSLAEALESFGVSPAHLPTWIPEDYAIANISENSNSKMYRITANYESHRGELQIRALITSGNAIHAAEKDSGGYIIQHNDLEVYVYTNAGDFRALWFADDITFTVSAYSDAQNAITEQELLTIIDSIPK